MPVGSRGERMLRLEQLRAELLERFERIDRRFAQQEHRLERLNQRTGELAERLEAIRLAVSSRPPALEEEPAHVEVPVEG